jgi:hypothetical protein
MFSLYSNYTDSVSSGDQMGRSKKELKKIHNRKIRKAKQKLQLFKAGQISLKQLTQRAKHFLNKGKKKRTTLA